MHSAIEEKSLYGSQFAQLEKGRFGAETAWLGSMRKAALDRFHAVGFPSIHDEEWRFTNVAPITRIAFKPASNPPAVPLTESTLDRFTFGKWRGAQIVVLNGHYSPELSTLQYLPKGLEVESLASALRTKPDLLAAHLSHYAGCDEQAFVALNTAFLRDGAFVHIAKGAVIEEPVHILFLTSGEDQATVSHPRNLILAEANSQCRILESYAGMEGGIYLTNAVTEVVLADNAIVDHYRVQRESLQAFHVSTLQVQQSRSSNFSTHSVSLGGALVRNDVNAVLNGEGCETILNGLYVAHGTQHMDTHTRIDHAQPHCNSRELYKGILDEKARGVFNGRILVRQGAQKTDSRQTNKNLLLSEDALANTNPQLEIYADDVKCTHGATVGQLSAEAIFYLRSRGLGVATARQLLTYAFANEITRQIKIEPVRKDLEALLFSQMPDDQGVMGSL